MEPSLFQGDGVLLGILTRGGRRNTLPHRPASAASHLLVQDHVRPPARPARSATGARSSASNPLSNHPDLISGDLALVLLRCHDQPIDRASSVVASPTVFGCGLVWVAELDEVVIVVLLVLADPVLGGVDEEVVTLPLVYPSPEVDAVFSIAHPIVR